MKRWISVLLVAVFLLSLAACGEDSPAPVPETVQETETATEPATEESRLECAGTDEMPWYNAELTDLGLGLLRGSMNGEKNVLISPVSVLAALSMTANGAEGETLTQMETVLGRNKDALNQWYERDIVKEPSGHLYLANGIYLKDDPELIVKEDFLQTIEKWYETGIYMTSFNESTLRDINLFVEDKTNGMVKNILDEIPEEAVMYLVNALAFEARWDAPYQANQISEQVFTTEDGREQTVELMYMEEDFSYVENELCTGFLKNYEGGRYAFVALLPKEGMTVEALTDALSGDAVAKLLNYRWEGKVLTAIPKFQTEFDMEMSEVLRAMGMTDAFDVEKADFSTMGTYAGENIFINQVLHKTFISVGEQGTRAGAATVVEMDAGAAMPEEIKEVILNRPFFYMIYDTQTNMPIFMGTFMDARAEGTSVPVDEPDIFYSPAEDPCLIEG